MPGLPPEIERDPSVRAVSTSSFTACPREPLFRPGDIVGGAFEIKQLLGEGGMGQVYEAHDRLLNRRVAIKAAWPHDGARGVRAEAQALAAIRHPSVVTVFSVGDHEGIEYAVMERVFGVSLEAQVERRRLAGTSYAIEEAAAVLARVADALAVVHDAGIAHYDVKPSNVMIAPGDRVVLMDFGIFQAEIDAADRLVSGSPHYMAPERFLNMVERGNAFLVDVYAFGVMAYELVAGELPFAGDTAMKLLQKHVQQNVPPLGERRPDAPSRLVALVHELLAKDPKDRPQSMQGVASRLRALHGPRTHAPEHGHEAIIVEDDPASAGALRSLVAAALPHSTVRVVSDARSAVVALHGRAPDLLVLDIDSAPQASVGSVMCLHAAHAFDPAAVVALTSRPHARDVETLRALGVEHIVSKGRESAHQLAALLDALARKPPRDSLRPHA